MVGNLSYSGLKSEANLVSKMTVLSSGSLSLLLPTMSDYADRFVKPFASKVWLYRVVDRESNVGPIADTRSPAIATLPNLVATGALTPQPGQLPAETAAF